MIYSRNLSNDATESQPGSVLMFCSYYFKNGYPRALCSYVL